MMQRCSTIVPLVVFRILAPVLMPFLARPVTAASQSSALDVAQIDTFVREQAQHEGPACSTRMERRVGTMSSALPHVNASLCYSLDFPPQWGDGVRL